MKKLEWFFYPVWILLALISVPIALAIDLGIMKILTNIYGSYIYVNGVQHITEDYLAMYFLIPLAGLITGLLQYGLLRRYLPQMGFWVWATAGGWVLGGLLLLLLGWLKLWELSRINIDVIFIVMGLAIGISQWLLLRQRLPQAGWWIAATLAGWFLLGLVTGESINQYGLFIFGLFPACLTALVLGLILNQSGQRDGNTGTA